MVFPKGKLNFNVRKSNLEMQLLHGLTPPDTIINRSVSKCKKNFKKKTFSAKKVCIFD